MKNYKNCRNYTALICLGLAAATPAMAQTGQAPGGENKTTGENKPTGENKAANNPQDAPSTKAMEEAIKKMDDAMKAVDYTGNPDVDFVAKMIPHHEGAINMAKVELQYGKNPRIRRLAEIIVKSQGAQVVKMRDWLRKNAGATKQP